MIKDPANLRDKANIINTDVAFLKQLALPALQASSMKPTRVNNIDNLSQLLKLKNSKYTFSQQARQNGQEWIKRKGGDVNPLIQRVKQIKQQTKTKQEQKKCQSQCHFYMPKLTLSNQDVYIQKNFQFGVMSVVQSIMNQGNSTGNLAKRVLKRRRLDRQNNIQSNFQSLPSLNLQIRNPRKKQQYLKATKQIVNIEGVLKGTQWAMIYRVATKQQFWEIITGQITNLLDQSNRSIPLSALAIASLKMVQEQFNSTLPSNYESILHYLTNNYLGKMRGQYQSEGILGPIWGISFMLYRAGRKQQFYRYIPNQQLKTLFQQADKSIMNGRPKKFTGIQEIQDLFQNQLLYALKGIGKCSTKTLCDPDTLDIVWVFLRNVGIFPEDASSFINIRRQLFQSYKGPLLTQGKIKNLLYLLGYSEIAEIGPNQIMDRDDYIHFLIALYHSPAYELVLDNKKETIQKCLTAHLIQYIQQLLLQHKQQYLYYMIVMPQSKMAEELSSIISSSQLLQTIDWKYLSRKIQPVIYRRILQLTLQKYVILYQQYVQVAKKEYQLLDDGKQALKYILQMYIKSGIGNKNISTQQLKKGEMFANDILSKNQALKQQFGAVFAFFQQHRKLIQLIKERDEFKIYNFLRQSNFILISDQLRVDTRNALDKLVQFGGFQCYIQYIKNLVKSYQISLTRMSKTGDLLQLQGLTFSALDFLAKTQPYAQFFQRESIRDLMRILQQAINRR